MQTFFGEILVDPTLAKQLPLDEAKVLSIVCQLSAQLRMITHTFAIPHTSSRLGWIVNPSPKIVFHEPLLVSQKIIKILKKQIKSGLLLEHLDPFAVLPNASEIVRQYGVKWHMVELGDARLQPDDWGLLGRQEYWDSIPGVSDGLPKVTLASYVEHVKNHFDWAKEYKMLDHVPEHLIEASHLISTLTGFVPDSKDWVAAVSMLLATANGSMQTLREGLEKGNEMRKSVPFAGVRSFQGAVREVAAQKRVTVNGGMVGNKQRIVV